MPFGLTNAPAIFQGLMNDIFYDLLDVYCIVYLDISIYSETIEDHQLHVQAILECLLNSALYAKLEKCKFSKNRIKFLGYITSNMCIEMNPNRTATISNWPIPTEVKELQSFLGFTSFYRMFIPSYTETTQPVLKLLKKDAQLH